MARWQLQCSGRAEEAQCKFCSETLPCWRETLFREVIPKSLKKDTTAADDDADASSDGGGDRASSDGASPVNANEDGAVGHLGAIKGDIIVKFNGQSFRCTVKTGNEGLEDFMRQIRQKCGIPEDKMSSLNLTYRCKDPNTGSQMTLEGVNKSAFDAAVLCSAVQDKIKQEKKQRRQQEQHHQEGDDTQQRRRHGGRNAHTSAMSTSSSEGEIPERLASPAAPPIEGVVTTGTAPDSLATGDVGDSSERLHLANPSALGESTMVGFDDGHGQEGEPLSVVQQQPQRGRAGQGSAAPQTYQHRFMPSFYSLSSLMRTGCLKT